jgi:hypothetical protein
MAANTLKRLLTAVVAGTEMVSARSIMRCTLLWLTLPGLAAAQTNQTSPNFGSVPSGTASSEVLQLTHRDAIIRALRYNLGQIESGENSRIARGQRLRALSTLLMQVSAGSSESVQQLRRSVYFRGGVRWPCLPFYSPRQLYRIRSGWRLARLSCKGSS